MKFFKNQLNWIPVYVYMGIIFFLSAQSVIVVSGNEIGGVEENGYFWHVIEYFVLSLLVCRAFNKPKFKRNLWIFTLLIGGLYAISDEIHQYFVPGRIFSYGDIFADLIGITLGIIIYKIVKNFKQ